MNWLHLIEVARLLAGAPGTATRLGRPRQIMLRKAISAAYYAVFHALCASNADVLIGTSPAVGRLAWSRTYRALEHGDAKNRMIQHMADLPPGIQTFAKTFNDLQERRHAADYNPDVRFQRSNVIALIDRAESAIHSLYTADIAERRALASLVLLRAR